jgi:predicted Fe-Mo cluster-binding NifX family protein
MKIVVSASGKTLDAPVDPRFGRCAYFVFVDSDSFEFEAFSNESAMASGGAGIQAAQFVVNKGAGAIVTGQLGPNASMTLQASGIPVFLGAAGTVTQAVEMYRNGQLQRADGPSVAGHFGLGQAGPGAMQRSGPGGGMGRGMGAGRGMGRAMRAGGSMGTGGMPIPPEPMKDQVGSKDLTDLKAQVKGLQDQMERIAGKLDRMDEKAMGKKPKKTKQK